MFQVGGTDVYLHKYLGTKPPTDADATADQPIYDVIKETNIQDLLFLENRDRKYDSSVYKIRGVYNVQDIDFNLSQFALFIDNDTVFMTVHINDFVKLVGRKPLSGDVIELPHLKDEFALNDADIALPRFFVISDIGRAAEGFSVTWYPHLYRLKLTKLNDQQQFADILVKPAGADEDKFVGEYDASASYSSGDIIRYNGVLYTVTASTTGNTPPNSSYYSVYNGSTLQEILSTKNKELEINDAILAQAEENTPLSGYETQQFYTLAVDEKGKPALLTVDDDTAPPDASSTSIDASRIAERPKRSGYTGYLLGDGIAPNGVDFGHGISFPAAPIEGDFFLRTDMMPNRLFRFDGVRWIKREDAVRTALPGHSNTNTLKGGFINNTATDVIAGQTVPERQALSKALNPKVKPKADL